MSFRVLIFRYLGSLALFLLCCVMTYGCESTSGNSEWSSEIASEINSKIIPFEIYKYDGEELFYLVLYDYKMDNSLELVFSEHGWSQDGCAWTDVALQLIRTQEKELENSTTFDCEAGMFVARSKSKESLKQLGLLMSHVFNNTEELSNALASAEMVYY